MSQPRVLVVDDDPDVLEILTWAVNRAGFVAEAHDKFDLAKQVIHGNTPQGLVTDVRLGAFNGMQLAVLLRAVNPGAPVIVISAFNDSMIRRDAEAMGAIFLTKPVSAEQLGLQLRQLFDVAAQTG
jgi:DNA-binding NtrC family response regulator